MMAKAFVIRMPPPIPCRPRKKTSWSIVCDVPQSAVVTETGGALSHCAIVAREYGIPAVVGVYGATRAIQTGQTITVDGTSGLITLDTE